MLNPVTLDEFFANQPFSRQLFEAVQQSIAVIGPAEIQVSKSQVAFRRRKAFAIVWMPEMYLHRQAAPLVLTLSFRQRIESPRWKEVVEPHPGWFTHHLELYAIEEVDEQVRGWLQAAYEIAG